MNRNVVILFVAIQALLVQSAFSAEYDCDSLDAGDEQLCRSLHEFNAIFLSERRGLDTREALRAFTQTVNENPHLIGYTVNGINTALLGRFERCEDPAIQISLSVINTSVVLQNEFGPDFELTCDAGRKQEGFSAPIAILSTETPLIINSPPVLSRASEELGGEEMGRQFSVSSFLLSPTSDAQVVEQTSHYDETIEKHIIRTNISRNEHPLSVLPSASIGERNHALFFGATSQTLQEARRVMLLERICSGTHVEVDEQVLILSSYHCLLDSANFHPYFLGFEGVWEFSDFDYAIATMQRDFDVTNVGYDVALFYEHNAAIKRSRYFKPLKLADQLPGLYEKLTFIGYPDGIGPIEIECVYYGLDLNLTRDIDSKYRLRGKLYDLAPIPRTPG